MSASNRRDRPSLLRSIVIVLITMLAASAARADGKVGVVLMHGKLGVPMGVAVGGNTIGAQLISALKAAGFLVATPEMCWSRRREFDKSRSDCLAEIDQAAAQLKGEGATKIVVAGLSLGGNAALSYGGAHPELYAVVALNPADDPQTKSRRPEIQAALARAHQFADGGKGDVKDLFNDVNTGAQGSYPMAINTTAKIYLSFFDPAVSPGLGDSAAKVTAPLLWIAGSEDPTQRNAAALFARSEGHNPADRLVPVAGNHISTPDNARDAVVSWLNGLAKP